MERRLAAILAADVVDYSRPIRADVEGTIAALRALLVDLIAPKIAAHHGRIANTAGDSFLLVFPSAVETVRCSIAVQVDDLFELQDEICHRVVSLLDELVWQDIFDCNRLIIASPQIFLN